MPPQYSEADARRAVDQSRSYAETLRKLGMCHGGGSQAILKKWLAIWGISTSHFDPYAAQRGPRRDRPRQALAEIMREGSRYHRGHLKQRLYDEGVKQRRCELCGQGEEWRGRRMALILDHVNGVRDDNRLENLRIVCPNCAATLSTHCGKKNRLQPRRCRHCDGAFQPRIHSQHYCCRSCALRARHLDVDAH